MRMKSGVTLVALMFVVACASRTTTAEGPAAGGAGAQAAARISVEQHEGFMKTISATNAALGKKIMNNDLADAAKDAQTIATTFGEVERFWTQNNKADAVTWAQQGRQNATDLAGALAAGNAEKVAASRKAMSGACGSCHTAYREGSPQTGGYTLKAGVVAP
jgi:cytochrome c556